MKAKKSYLWATIANDHDECFAHLPSLFKKCDDDKYVHLLVSKNSIKVAKIALREPAVKSVLKNMTNDEKTQITHDFYAARKNKNGRRLCHLKTDRYRMGGIVESQWTDGRTWVVVYHVWHQFLQCLCGKHHCICQRYGSAVLFTNLGSFS